MHLVNSERVGRQGRIAMCADGRCLFSPTSRRRASADPLLRPRQVSVAPDTSLLGAPFSDGRFLSNADPTTGALTLFDPRARRSRVVDPGGSGEFAYLSTISGDACEGCFLISAFRCAGASPALLNARLFPRWPVAQQRLPILKIRCDQGRQTHLHEIKLGPSNRKIRERWTRQTQSTARGSPTRAACAGRDRRRRPGDSGDITIPAYYIILGYLSQADTHLSRFFLGNSGLVRSCTPKTELGGASELAYSPIPRQPKCCSFGLVG